MSKQGTLISVAEDQQGKSPRIVTETEPFPVSLFDGLGNPIGSFRGSLDIHDADVHTASINHYMYRDLATYTLAAPIASQSRTLTVTSATGIVVGSDLHLFDDNTGSHDHSFLIVTAVAGTLITVNRPIDKAYTVAGTRVVRISRNMNQVGTAGSPFIYELQPQPGIVWHMTSMSFAITSSSPMDDSLFGSVGKLVNGVALRYVDITNSNYSTYSTWQDNSQIFLDCFVTEYAAKAPSGYYGYRGKLDIKETYGSIIRLANDPGDQSKFETLIQDNLSTLQTFNITFHGHIEGG